MSDKIDYNKWGVIAAKAIGLLTVIIGSLTVGAQSIGESFDKMGNDIDEIEKTHLTDYKFISNKLQANQNKSSADYRELSKQLSDNQREAHANNVAMLKAMQDNFKSLILEIRK